MVCCSFPEAPRPVLPVPAGSACPRGGPAGAWVASRAARSPRPAVAPLRSEVAIGSAAAAARRGAGEVAQSPAGAQRGAAPARSHRGRGSQALLAAAEGGRGRLSASRPPPRRASLTREQPPSAPADAPRALPTPA